MSRAGSPGTSAAPIGASGSSSSPGLAYGFPGEPPRFIPVPTSSLPVFYGSPPQLLPQSSQPQVFASSQFQGFPIQQSMSIPPGFSCQAFPLSTQPQVVFMNGSQSFLSLGSSPVNPSQPSCVVSHGITQAIVIPSSSISSSSPVSWSPTASSGPPFVTATVVETTTSGIKAAPSSPEAIEPSAKKRKYKRTAKPLQSPKNPLSAYLFFVSEQRSRKYRENDSRSFKVIASELGDKWRNLPQEQKAKYEEMAWKDKLRYHREKLALMETKQEQSTTCKSVQSPDAGDQSSTGDSGSDQVLSENSSVNSDTLESKHKHD